MKFMGYSLSSNEEIKERFFMDTIKTKKKALETNKILNELRKYPHSLKSYSNCRNHKEVKMILTIVLKDPKYCDGCPCLVYVERANEWQCQHYGDVSIDDPQFRLQKCIEENK